MYKRIKFLLSIILSALLILTTIPFASAQNDTVASEPNVTVSITASGGNGQIVENMGMPDEAVRKYGIIGNYARGTKFVLTAKETDCEFLYWKDTISRRVISRDKTYVAIAGTDISISAVFRSPSTDKKLVMFQNSNGYIISSEYADDTRTISVPSNPSMHGYIFNSWLLNGNAQAFNNNTINVSELSGDSVYIASYTQSPAYYNINVIGGSGSGRYIYNEKLVVSLDESLIPEGKVFAYWSNGKDVLSYDKTYTFYVGADAYIYAVYDAVAPAQKQPAISVVVADMNTSAGKFTFLSERSLPLDCEFVETGILIHTSESFDLDTSGISKAKALSQAPSGQFSITKCSMSAGSIWYARAYMIYIKDGASNIIYSDVVNTAPN